MKILHVNHSDLSGGAAIAAMRLHKALLDFGVDSNYLVLNKFSNEPKTLGPSTKFRKYFNLARLQIDQLPLYKYKNRSTGLFSPSWHGSSEIIKTINIINPDIVHFHWINNGMIKITDIRKIKAPIIWSMHDMWPFTGGCHYDDKCGLYTNNCGTCKVLGSNKASDLSRSIFNRKLKVFKKKTDITFVGLSKWISECAMVSTLLKEKKVINLPNLIDPNIYKPLDKNYSRKLYKLPLDKKLVLFGAMNSTVDPRKGFAELVNAINCINESTIELVIFGNRTDELKTVLKHKIHFVGELFDTQSLVALYNAVDVMIVPSKQENLSNIIMESLSCGTPVVGFDIGGNKDMIKHMQNGYLAEPFSMMDLRNGIGWALNEARNNRFSIDCREYVLSAFSPEIVLDRYIKLYKNTL